MGRRPCCRRCGPPALRALLTPESATLPVVPAPLRIRFAVVLAVAVATTSAASRGRAAEPGETLRGAARAAARPPECGQADRGAPARWDRVRTPGLGRFCALLSRGQGALATSPEKALALAVEADAALPGRAAPLVLRARAEARAGRLPEAWTLFGKARALDVRSIEAPLVLVDLAHVALGIGEPAEALDAYRSLVQRLGLLSDPALEARLLVQVGVLAMASGPEQLAEAAGYLLEAGRRPGVPGLSDSLLAALALVRDRQGREAEAEALAREATGPWALEAARERAVEAAKRGANSTELPPSELHAMIARLAEGRDPDLARERWTAYVAATPPPPSAYLEQARARLARLTGRAPSGAR